MQRQTKAELREEVQAVREELRMTREALRKAHDDGTRIAADRQNLLNSNKQATDLNFKLGRELEIARERLEAFEKLDIGVWEAYRSPGSPICVSTNDDTKEGLSVNIYRLNGVVVGVSIHEREFGRKVGGAGLLPYEAD